MPAHRAAMGVWEWGRGVVGEVLGGPLPSEWVRSQLSGGES